MASHSRDFYLEVSEHFDGLFVFGPPFLPGDGLHGGFEPNPTKGQGSPAAFLCAGQERLVAVAKDMALFSLNGLPVMAQRTRLRENESEDEVAPHDNKDDDARSSHEGCGVEGLVLPCETPEAWAVLRGRLDLVLAEGRSAAARALASESVPTVVTVTLGTSHPKRERRVLTFVRNHFDVVSAVPIPSGSWVRRGWSPLVDAALCGDVAETQASLTALCSVTQRVRHFFVYGTLRPDCTPVRPYATEFLRGMEGYPAEVAGVSLAVSEYPVVVIPVAGSSSTERSRDVVGVRGWCVTLSDPDPRAFADKLAVGDQIEGTPCLYQRGVVVVELRGSRVCCLDSVTPSEARAAHVAAFGANREESEDLRPASQASFGRVLAYVYYRSTPALAGRAIPIPSGDYVTHCDAVATSRAVRPQR